MMKRILSLTLAAVMLAAALTGCSSGQPGSGDAKELTPEARTTLYKTAIENARSAEDNEYMPVITSADDDMATLLFDLMGLSEEDMNAYAISASAMNVRAYGIAAVYPAADRSDAVRDALQGFVDQQKQNFELYLADQYDIASNARLESLEDGTILLVMCENQDDIFTSIKASIEAGK